MSHPPRHHVALASWPTPVEAAPRLSIAVGLDAGDLWLKRDDLTGLGAGGNKVRKLEWTVGAALADGADVLVTTGAPQSNHARLTAAAAARVGIDAVLVFPGHPVSAQAGNLILDGILGARVVWVGDSSSGDAGRRELDAAAHEVAQQLVADGRRPVIIPFGGSNATGAHGNRLAADEIRRQVPDVAHVVCAVGSGGTMAGLVAGLGPHRVLGIHAGAVAEPHLAVSGLLNAMQQNVDGAELRIRADQVGEGYEALTPETAHAVRLAARREGVVLDPVYSGRALAGLMAEIRDGGIVPGERVVLLASGGLPGLFGHPAVSELVDGADR